MSDFEESYEEEQYSSGENEYSPESLDVKAAPGGPALRAGSNEVRLRETPSVKSSEYRDSEQFSSPGDERERFVEAKGLRKQADEDAKILANRIALLKSEEQKAWKKIEETRKRAREIMEVRQRNMEAAQKKQEEQAAKEEEERIRNYNIRLQKEQTAANKQNTKQSLMSKLKNDVQNIKRSKQENNEIIASQRDDDLSRRTKLRNEIQGSKRNLAEQKRIKEEEIRAKARAELEARAEEELRVKEEREAAIAQMEQEEMELIARLQNTQSLQRDAYESLESAISGEMPTNL